MNKKDTSRETEKSATAKRGKTLGARLSGQSFRAAKTRGSGRWPFQLLFLLHFALRSMGKGHRPLYTTNFKP